MANQDDIPSSKVDRASRFLRTGAKVGLNYAKHYGKSVFSKVDRDELDRANAEDMLDAFTKLRGTALKMGQMLSLDNINFSSAFTEVMQKAQYSVPPMSAPLTIRTFQKAVGKDPEQVFDTFDINAHKAASMGQVHRATKDGKTLAVKIQYPNVADSIQSDIAMVRSMAPRLANLPAAELRPYFDEVEQRLMEEADYTIELQNSMAFKTACKDLEGIVFPDYYPELSGPRVITMEWLDGLHLKEFMARNPSQEIRTLVGQRIWNLYEFQMHELRRLNADPHPGNFLFREDGTVGVLDFGCTKPITDDLYDRYFIMAQPDLFEQRSQQELEQIFVKLELIRPDDKPEKREKLIDLFTRLISLISRPYHEGTFYFGDKGFYEEVNQVGLEISNMREVRGSKDFLFVNRTYFGLFSLFQSLDVTLDTRCRYHDFLNASAKAKLEAAG